MYKPKFGHIDIISASIFMKKIDALWWFCTQILENAAGKLGIWFNYDFIGLKQTITIWTLWNDVTIYSSYSKLEKNYGHKQSMWFYHLDFCLDMTKYYQVWSENSVKIERSLLQSNSNPC